MTTFKVEDDTGLEDATSYVSEAYADDYLGASWAADSAAKQAALMIATEYADARWGSKLRGTPLLATQSLEIPRNYLYDRYGNQVDGVPDKWKKAVCLYAKESVAGTLYPTPPSGSVKDIKKKKVQVGPIVTETEYQGLATAATFLAFPLADKLARLFTYLANGGVARN
jgi:hypothetical protein